MDFDKLAAEVAQTVERSKDGFVEPVQFARQFLAAYNKQKEPAKKRFDDCMEDYEETPIERLRFFCSLAMDGRDWLDVEPFFDALTNNKEKS